MENLYKPLLEHIFGKPVRCLLICKYNTTETPGPFVSSIEDFISTEGLGFATWHWML